MKYLGGRSFFLRTEHWILIAAFLSAFLSGHWTLDTAHARELGVHGVIYPIQEEDPLQLIQQKLKGMEERGEIEQQDDLEQKAWAFCRIQCSVSSSTGLILGLDPRTEDKIQKNNKVRLILVKGAPLALSEEWGVLVYFDQGGFLCKKLRIQHIPAVVTQDKTRIIVEEVVLGGRS